jgi:transmembrane sensor
MKTHNQRVFKRMVRKYLSGRANDKERAAIERYYNLFSIQEDILEDENKESVNQIGSRLKSSIDLKITNQDKPSYQLFQRLVAAVAIVMTVSAGLYFYSNKSPKYQNGIVQHKLQNHELLPGSNKAVLSLSDGSQIILNSAEDGVLSNQNGVTATKTTDGSVIYNNTSSSASQLMNSISTPKGGQYQVILSDGTSVWLNAGSKLTYPVAFSGNNRNVTLAGEAYFEVAKDTKRPFQVITNQQQITVLGTHFNISAYQDDAETKTTLLEGKVSVRQTGSSTDRTLAPGEQATSISGNKKSAIQVTRIDTDEAIAWQKGYFQFQDEDLESVLRKISRWYDVDIYYAESRIPSGLYFNGTISKYKNASQVLKKLELTGGVHFQIEGRRIIVMP